MSVPREPAAAKLITGLLFTDFEVRRRVLAALQERFGPLDFLAEARPFTYTDYYEPELGSGIQRQTAGFAELVRPEDLPDIKLFTNGIEAQYTWEGRRSVNIDPGLLSEERVVLATGKNFTHRIYLREGIYADLTLIYQSGSYQTLPWTYPDYRDETLRHFLGALRRKLMVQLSGRIPRKIPS